MREAKASREDAARSLLLFFAEGHTRSAFRKIINTYEQAPASTLGQGEVLYVDGVGAGRFRLKGHMLHRRGDLRAFAPIQGARAARFNFPRYIFPRITEPPGGLDEVRARRAPSDVPPPRKCAPAAASATSLEVIRTRTEAPPKISYTARRCLM